MWEKFRNEKLKIYQDAKNSGKVDEDIIELLDYINSLENFVTLSSCSGRIAVIDLAWPGKKNESEFLGKWHSPVEAEKVREAALRCEKTAWLIQYPPIIHIACRNIEFAKVIMRLANDAGFRRCGIISLNQNVVEVASLERIELPIAEKGVLMISDAYLSYVVGRANEKLIKGKEKLGRFYSRLRNFINLNQLG